MKELAADKPETAQHATVSIHCDHDHPADELCHSINEHSLAKHADAPLPAPDADEPAKASKDDKNRRASKGRVKENGQQKGPNRFTRAFKKIIPLP